jgi:hypothetical protein
MRAIEFTSEINRANTVQEYIWINDLVRPIQWAKLGVLEKMVLPLEPRVNPEAQECSSSCAASARPPFAWIEFLLLKSLDERTRPEACDSFVVGLVSFRSSVRESGFLGRPPGGNKRHHPFRLRRSDPLGGGLLFCDCLFPEVARPLCLCCQGCSRMVIESKFQAGNFPAIRGARANTFTSSGSPPDLIFFFNFVQPPQ